MKRDLLRRSNVGRLLTTLSKNSSAKPMYNTK